MKALLPGFLSAAPGGLLLVHCRRVGGLGIEVGVRFSGPSMTNSEQLVGPRPCGIDLVTRFAGTQNDPAKPATCKKTALDLALQASKVENRFRHPDSRPSGRAGQSRPPHPAHPRSAADLPAHATPYNRLGAAVNIAAAVFRRFSVEFDSRDPAPKEYGR